jgi:CheY-like chemotaxis protein
VLVVEDDPDVRDLTVNMFTDLGYDTVEAADGKQALEILQSTPAIDLLFTDVVLPGGMSGADIAREASRHFPDIKILFTSGYADNVLAQFGQTDAGVHLINKPFRKHDLARQVHVALNQPPS